MKLLFRILIPVIIASIIYLILTWLNVSEFYQGFGTGATIVAVSGLISLIQETNDHSI